MHLLDFLSQLIASSSEYLDRLPMRASREDREARMDGQGGQGRFKYLQSLEHFHMTNIPEFHRSFHGGSDDLREVIADERVDNPRTVVRSTCESLAISACDAIVENRDRAVSESRKDP